MTIKWDRFVENYMWISEFDELVFRKINYIIIIINVSQNVTFENT